VIGIDEGQSKFKAAELHSEDHAEQIALLWHSGAGVTSG
jgi:hypothetical protein